MRSIAVRLAALAAVPVLALTACASQDSGQATSGPLKSVTVEGEAGKEPTLTLKTSPLKLTETTTQVIDAGDGEKVKKGQKVTVDYVLFNGKDGKKADTSFGAQPATFTADPGQLMPGLAKGLIDQKVGSRVLVGVPPKDGFAEQGNEQLGVGKDDSILFVLDIKSASSPLAKATGAPVQPQAGLPTVKEDAKGVPTVTVPKTPAPTSLVAQPLIEGKGKKVEKGQTITAHYTGLVYGTSKVFDSSWTRGTPADFPIGEGQVIKGWDQALVGRTIGSRMLLVIPPALGYGAQGNPQAGIKGTDTLVFVVDILDAS